MQEQLDAMTKGGATDSDTAQMRGVLSSMMAPRATPRWSVSDRPDVSALSHSARRDLHFVSRMGWPTDAHGQPCCGRVERLRLLLAYIAQWSANGVTVISSWVAHWRSSGGDANGLISSMSVGMGRVDLLICGAVLVLHALWNCAFRFTDGLIFSRKMTWKDPQNWRPSIKFVWKSPRGPLGPASSLREIKLVCSSAAALFGLSRGARYSGAAQGPGALGCRIEYCP